MEIFLLNGFAHNVEFDYSFRGTQTSGRNSSISENENLLQEKYQAKINYSLLDPNMYNGTARVSIGFSQDLFSGSVGRSSPDQKDFTLRYGFEGRLFTSRPFPVSYSVASDSITTTREFGRSYDTTSDTVSVASTVANRFLMSNISYMSQQSRSSGLSTDYASHYNFFQFLTENRYNDISQTNVGLSYTDTASEATRQAALKSTRSLVNASFKNHLTWKNGPFLNRQVDTNIEYRSEEGDLSGRYLTLMERGSWDVGKALTVSADWRGNRNKPGNEAADTAIGDEDVYHVQVQNRLFDSFQLILDLKRRDSSLPDGSEREDTGFLTFNYHKILPQNGFLQLSVVEGLGSFDRKSRANAIDVIDSRYTASYFEPVQILVPGVVADTIVIRNADPAKRTLPYVANVDYIVDASTPNYVMIYVIPDGDIPDNELLLVSFTARVDRSLEYTYANHSVTSLVSLLDGALQFFGSYADYAPTIKNGGTFGTSLQGYRSLNVGTEVTTTTGERYRLEYIDQNDHIMPRKSIEGSAALQKTVWEGTLSLTARDRFSRVERSESDAFDGVSTTTFTENSLGLSAAYTTTFLGMIQANMRGNFLYFTGPYSRTDVSADTLFRMQFGSLYAEASPEIHWRKTSSGTTAEEIFRVRFIRYF